MKYFRHFSNASTSLKVQMILSDMGLEGYAQYFLLLELLNEKFDGKNTKVELHSDEISSKVRIKFSKKLETFIQKLANFSLLSFELSGKVYKIDCPILLELMDKDSKYNRKKRVTCEKNATLDIEEEEEEDKEEEEEEDREEEEPRSFVRGVGTTEFASSQKPDSPLQESSSKTPVIPSPPSGEPIPIEVLGYLECTLMYPKEIIETVRKDAWLMYMCSTDPKKNWARFVGAYFKNERQRITNEHLRRLNGSTYTHGKGRQKESGKEYMERMMNAYEELSSGE